MPRDLVDYPEHTGSSTWLETTKKIVNAYENNESFNMIISGKTGSGKSIFAIRVIAQVKGVWDLWTNDRGVKVPVLLEHDWDAWKQFLVFDPKEYIGMLDKQQRSGESGQLIVSDDAGYWWSNQDWAQELSKRVSDFKNVSRTVFNSELYTTPDPQWLLKRIRSMPGQYYGKIIHTSAGPYGTSKYRRQLKGYERWVSPDFTKEGVRLDYIDNFKALMPARPYKEYKEKRRGYAMVAIERINKALDAALAKRKNSDAEMLQRQRDTLRDSLSDDKLDPKWD